MKERAHARSLDITGGGPPARKLCDENSTMTLGEHSATAVVNAYLQRTGAPFRAVAEGEWGLVLDDVGGRPLDVGLRLADGLLRAQAWVAPAGTLDPHLLLHRNRLATLVRYAESLAGDVHVHSEVPESAVDAAVLDRMLGLLVEAAAVVRAGGTS
jgi:hypothetical protein